MQEISHELQTKRTELMELRKIVASELEELRLKREHMSHQRENPESAIQATNRNHVNHHLKSRIEVLSQSVSKVAEILRSTCSIEPINIGTI